MPRSERYMEERGAGKEERAETRHQNSLEKETTVRLICIAWFEHDVASLQVHQETNMQASLRPRSLETRRDVGVHVETPLHRDRQVATGSREHIRVWCQYYQR